MKKLILDLVSAELLSLAAAVAVLIPLAAASTSAGVAVTIAAVVKVAAWLDFMGDSE